MRITWGHLTTELREWPTEIEMRGYVLACKSGNLILGEDALQYHRFYSIEFYLESSDLSSLRVGLISEGHGLVPHLLLRPEKSQALFGFNWEVACVNISEKRLVFSLDLDSLFYCFIPLFSYERILVRHEIGVIAIDEAGNKQWSYTKDIITKLLIDETTLELHFFDKSSVRLDIMTGRSL
jgi:hypothetical protein